MIRIHNYILALAAIVIIPLHLSGQTASKLVDLQEVSKEQLLEDEGKTLRIKGFVERTNSNATGINFLNFKGSDFQCITFARYIRNFDEGAPVDIYKETWIEVTGVIENYRGNPQIKLTDPKQVKILPAPKPPKPVVITKTQPTSTDQTKKDTEQAEEEADAATVPIVNLKPEPGEKAPVVEIIDGVPALDWRTYFPSGKK